MPIAPPSNVIVVHADSGVFRATVGPDPEQGLSATGLTPENAVGLLSGKMQEAAWVIDATWQPEPPTPRSAQVAPADAPAAPAPAPAPVVLDGHE